MQDCREVKSCRVCGGPLEQVLDFGEQCLGGQFPKIGEPDPPRFPLVLCRCTGSCGLVQLGHTVNPELMFRSYGYRSGVTGTMRNHLKGIAEEAKRLFSHSVGNYSAALDIGGNDGTLLESLGDGWLGTVVDPSDVTRQSARFPPAVIRNVLSGFFPECLPADGELPWGPFHLIFSIACFYDVDDPVKFARAVHRNLATDGLWCLEVANWDKMMRTGAYDGICHEHLLYFDDGSLCDVIHLAGLSVRRASFNECNGGSIRAYAWKGSDDTIGRLFVRPDEKSWGLFVNKALVSAMEIIGYLRVCADDDLKVHLLGASTKANTWLQWCGIDTSFIAAASDRDPNKVGRQTPGTHIPIISEEQSRAMRPDVYVVGPWSFRDEIIAREKEFLDRGGRLVFPLPNLEEVKR